MRYNVVRTDLKERYSVIIEPVQFGDRIDYRVVWYWDDNECSGYGMQSAEAMWYGTLRDCRLRAKLPPPPFAEFSRIES